LLNTLFLILSRSLTFPLIASILILVFRLYFLSISLNFQLGTVISSIPLKEMSSRLTLCLLAKYLFIVFSASFFEIIVFLKTICVFSVFGTSSSSITIGFSKLKSSITLSFILLLTPLIAICPEKCSKVEFLLNNIL